MAKTDIKVDKPKSKKRDSTEIVKKSPVKKVKSENGEVKDDKALKFSTGSIRNIITRAG